MGEDERAQPRVRSRWGGLTWRNLLFAGVAQVFLAVTRWLLYAKDGGTFNLWLAVLVTCTATASVFLVGLKRREDRSGASP